MELTTPPTGDHWLLGDILQMPYWLSLLVVGLIMAARIGFAGYVLARTGRSPLWSLALLVPLLELVGIWVLAYVRWPRMDGPRDGGRRP